MHNKEIIVDVGANSGEFALKMLALNPEAFVLAIEPIPELCEMIRAKARDMQRNSDIDVLSCAVDVHERMAEFHVAEHEDQGVSSLLRLSAAEIQEDAYWKIRSDLYFDKTIQVQVRRLDNILSESGIRRVTFVKIDVQGLDIQVLRSLGGYLQNLDAGMLEITSTLDKKLYDGEEYDLHRALNALDEMGFDAYSIKPNDPASNEFNLLFRRKGVDYKALEQRLHLRQIPLYSGKDFWHAPSPNYRPLQEQDVADLQARIMQQDASSASQQHKLQQVDATLRAEQQHAHQLRAEIDLLQDRIGQQDVLAASQRQRLEQAEQQLASVYSSASWAVTRPLRRAFEFMRKLVGRDG